MLMTAAVVVMKWKKSIDRANFSDTVILLDIVVVVMQHFLYVGLVVAVYQRSVLVHCRPSTQLENVASFPDLNSSQQHYKLPWYRSAFFWCWWCWFIGRSIHRSNHPRRDRLLCWLARSYLRRTSSLYIPKCGGPLQCSVARRIHNIISDKGSLPRLVNEDYDGRMATRKPQLPSYIF